MKLIIMGAPGAGKGTQANKLSEKFNVPTISTGAVIRKEILEQSALGKIAKGYIDNGNLVPDELIMQFIKERLKKDDCSSGFILDGFPRTVFQAEQLFEIGYSIDKVLDIEVKDDVIITRLIGRLECPKCRTSFHKTDNPPKVINVCDKCQTALEVRGDDNPETIKKRLEVYHKMTEPIKDFYNKRNLLVVVYGEDKVEDTTRNVFKALGVID